MREKSSGERLLKKLYPSRSVAVREMLSTAAKLLGVSSNVLIIGETGAGKDYLAEAIHRAGSRSSGPFLRIDCSTIPADLFESELFGYEKGAFTDAQTRKEGKLELANGGTAYLDDLAALDLSVQPKLLRVIQERQFTRLGGARPLRLDARFITSLRSAPGEPPPTGLIRSDLLYRLNVVSIEVPPLRERAEDIPILAAAFLRESERVGLRFSDAALERMQRYAWPGNVRQLQNVVERAAVLAEGPEISESVLPPELFASPEGLLDRAATDQWTLEELERRYITKIIRATSSNDSRAARILGISRKTLLEKRKRYGLQRSGEGSTE